VNQGSRLPEGIGFVDVARHLSLQPHGAGQLDFDDLPQSGNSFMSHRGAENCVRGG
jgi:hypothetical protein